MDGEAGAVTGVQCGYEERELDGCDGTGAGEEEVAFGVGG